MFPWSHAAVGYLLLVGLWLVFGRRVSKAELVAALVGTQLADVIDKPLAWSFQVLPAGRSLAHSLLVAVPLAALVLGVAWRRRHPAVGLAFAVGYLSHLLGDTYVALYYWRTEELTFLLWPLLPPYPYDDVTGILTFVGSVELTRPLLVALLGSGLVGLVFLVHFSLAPRWPPRPT